jgi:hypothetical protein
MIKANTGFFGKLLFRFVSYVVSLCVVRSDASSRVQSPAIEAASGSALSDDAQAGNNEF